MGQFRVSNSGSGQTAKWGFVTRLRWREWHCFRVCHTRCVYLDGSGVSAPVNTVPTSWPPVLFRPRPFQLICCTEPGSIYVAEGFGGVGSGRRSPGQCRKICHSESVRPHPNLIGRQHTQFFRELLDLSLVNPSRVRQRRFLRCELSGCRLPVTNASNSPGCPFPHVSWR